MKIFVYFLVGFFIYSCNSTDNVIHTKMNSIINDFDSIDTKIIFVDIEINTEMDVVPPLVLNNGTIDSLAVINYLKNRHVEKRGEKQILGIRFDVPKEFNVCLLSHLISVSKKNIVSLHPEFEGDLVIVIKYSSKGNDWLELLPPPKRD